MKRIIIGIACIFLSIPSFTLNAQQPEMVSEYVQQFLTDKNIKSLSDLEVVLKRLVDEKKISKAEAQKIREQFKTAIEVTINANTAGLAINLDLSLHRIKDLANIASKPNIFPMNVDPKFKGSPQIMGKQTVLFATNRKISSGPLSVSAATNERSNEASFGEAVVSIPKAHRIGITERPGRYFYIWKQSEDQEKHFTIQSLNSLSEVDFTKRLSAEGDSTLIFVHGYNVPFEDSIYKAAQIAFDSNFDGPVLAFSWPAAGFLLGYVHDRDSARQAAPVFVEVLKKAKAVAPDRKIILVAHSLGSDVVTEALVLAGLAGERFNITELVLAAPDVDQDLFVQRAKQIKQAAGNVTIYASAADKALLASGAGAWGTRIGYIKSSGPNLVEGIEIIDVTAVGDSILELNHGTYSGNRSVLDDLGRIIKSGTRPPHLRSPTLRRMPDSINVKYWKYPE